MTDGTNCTLRGAVASVNAGSNQGGCAAVIALNGWGTDDTIEFSLPANTVILVKDTQIEINPAASGDGGLTINASPGIMLYAVGDHRLFHVTGGTSLSITGMTFIGGNAGSGFTDYGGAILVSPSGHTLTLEQCMFVGNQARDGGAVNAGAVIIRNSSFAGNSAISRGGAVRADAYGGAVTISNSTFSGNTATSGGGAMFTNAAATISNSTFSGNKATNSYGGAVSVNSNSVTISNSTFSGNQASSSSGAVYADTATISNSTFSGNEAGDRGGAVLASTATISNSTFSGNKATNNYGGAVLADTATISNSTFSGNSANNSGGAVSASNSLNARHLTLLNNTAGGSGQALWVNSSYGTATLHNSIIIGSNSNPQCASQNSAAFDNSSHNLEGWAASATAALTGTTTCGTTPVTVTGTPALSDIIDSAQAYNGNVLTQTLALPTGSQAIGKADSATSQMWDFTTSAWADATLDQRGFGRLPAASGRSVGAYEYKGLSFAPAALPLAEENVLYTSTALADIPGGGTPTYSFALDPAGNALPAGIHLSQNGTLSGTPTVSGPFTFDITVTDAEGRHVTQTMSLNILQSGALGFSPATLTPAQENVLYTSTTPVGTPVNGTSPYTYAVAPASTLPAGMALAADGVLSGTPATGTKGPHSFDVIVKDGTGSTATGTVNLTIAPGDLGFTPATLPPAQENVPYSESVGTPDHGSGTYIFTLDAASSTLPTGMTLGAGGVLSGTPATGTAGGSYTVSFTIADDEGRAVTGVQSVNLAVDPGNLIFTPASLPPAQENEPYSESVGTPDHGSGTYTFTLDTASSILPAGITTLSANGVLSGTPATGTAGGSYTVSFTIADNEGRVTTGVQSVNLAVDPGNLIFTPATLPPAQENEPYSGSVGTPDHGSGNYTFTLDTANSTLPADITLGADGVLSGTPATGTAGGPYTVSFTIADDEGRTTTGVQTVDLTIALGTLGFTAATLTPAEETVYYTNLVGTPGGGVPPYTFTQISSTLPTGMTLGADGVLSGTPPASTAGGPYTVSFTIADNDGRTTTGVHSVNLSILQLGTLGFSPATLPPAQENVLYTSLVGSPSGGTPPYTFTPDPAGSTLPTGMTLKQDGTLEGTPATGTKGPHSFGVIVSDGTGNTATGTVSLTIALGALDFPPATILPAAQETVYYARSVGTPGGGVPPYTFTPDPASSTLPTGMTLGAGGVLEGTPPAGTAGGPYTVSFTIADNDGRTTTGVHSVSLNIQLYALPTGATPIPVLPVPLLLGLAAAVGLLGRRRLTQRA